VPRLARDTLTLTVLPAGLVLLASALAARRGSESALFYFLLLGIPVSAAGGLAAFGRIVDEANGSGTAALARFQGALAALLVFVFFLGAVATRSLGLELGAPGLASAAIALGFLVLALQTLAAILPVAAR
jgi:hypothetical protein